MKRERFYLRDVEPGSLVQVVGAPELRGRVIRRAQGEGGSVSVRTLGGVIETSFEVPDEDSSENGATKTVSFTKEAGRLVQWSGGTRVEVEG